MAADVRGSRAVPDRVQGPRLLESIRFQVYDTASNTRKSDGHRAIPLQSGSLWRVVTAGLHLFLDRIFFFTAAA